MSGKTLRKDRAFNNQSLAKRFIIVFAGPFFNFILAVFFYFLIFISSGTVDLTILSLIDNSLSDIGMEKDDVIYSVNSVKVKTWSEVTLQTVKFITDEKDINFVVLRDAIFFH